MSDADGGSPRCQTDQTGAKPSARHQRARTAASLLAMVAGTPRIGRRCSCQLRVPPHAPAEALPLQHGQLTGVASSLPPCLAIPFQVVYRRM